MLTVLSQEMVQMKNGQRILWNGEKPRRWERVWFSGTWARSEKSSSSSRGGRGTLDSQENRERAEVSSENGKKKRWRQAEEEQLRQRHHEEKTSRQTRLPEGDVLEKAQEQKTQQHGVWNRERFKHRTRTFPG